MRVRGFEPGAGGARGGDGSGETLPPAPPATAVLFVKPVEVDDADIETEDAGDDPGRGRLGF